MEKVIVVEGYSFTDENMAKQARTEAEGVKYVKARTDMSKPDQVFNVYNRLLEQKMFQTPVGYAYLKELQEYLKTMPGIHSEDIKPISIAPKMVVEDSAGVAKIWRRRLEDTQKKFRISVLANLVFALAILAMFVIASTSNQATVLNYEKSIRDRYAQWEEELTKREQAVREEELRLDLDTDVTDE